MQKRALSECGGGDNVGVWDMYFRGIAVSIRRSPLAAKDATSSERTGGVGLTGRGARRCRVWGTATGR